MVNFSKFSIKQFLKRVDTLYSGHKTGSVAMKKYKFKCTDVKIVKFTVIAVLFVVQMFCASPVLSAQTSDSLNKRGVERAKDGLHERARDDFSRAVSIYNRESARLLHNKGVMFEKRGNIDDAIAAFEEAVRRNPRQAVSFERLGYLNYKQGRYSKAVTYGEKALEIDPDNRQVKSWIHDAYRKKIDTIEPTEEKEVAVNRDPIWQGKSPYQRIDPYRGGFYGTFDFSLRFFYQPDEDSVSGYQKSEGILTNFPYLMQAYYRPFDKIGFFGSLEHPYTGLGFADVVSQSERVECLYYMGRLVVGGGLLLNHYDGNIFQDKKQTLHDYKLGGSLHYEGEDYIMDLLFYPRLLLLDWSFLSGTSYDTAQFEFKYTYLFKPDFIYYTRIASYDYYFINHDDPLSDYYGFFDAAIGATVSNYSFFPGVDLKLTAEVGLRQYIIKTVDDPYSFLNGQSFLGIDKNRDNGSLVSGQDQKTTIFQLRFDERFSENFFIYQSVLLELAGYESDRHEYVIRFGAGYIR